MSISELERTLAQLRLSGARDGLLEFEGKSYRLKEAAQRLATKTTVD
jgi:hypothetical protein